MHEMKLVIAEKPGAAQSPAGVIGADKRRDGYLEGNGYLVSWCVGHLVELSAPEHYDERFAKWRLEDLPILPERFLYEVSAGTRKQYQILKTLMERFDVISLVCAADAGREGELIRTLLCSMMQVWM
jgi:DNA topoisomerase-3